MSGYKMVDLENVPITANYTVVDGIYAQCKRSPHKPTLVVHTSLNGTHVDNRYVNLDADSNKYIGEFILNDITYIMEITSEDNVKIYATSPITMTSVGNVEAPFYANFVQIQSFDSGLIDFEGETISYEISPVTAVKVGSTSISVPSDITSLTGYGWSVKTHTVGDVEVKAEAHNIVDVTNKKFIQNVSRVKVSTLTWSINTSGSYAFFQATVSDMDSESQTGSYYPIICDGLKSKRYSDLYNRGEDLVIAKRSNSRVCITDYSCETVSDFIAKYGDDYIYYNLATAVETDITSYVSTLNQYNSCNPGDIIEFVNAENFDIDNVLKFATTTPNTKIKKGRKK